MMDAQQHDVLIQTVADSISEPGDIEQTLSRITQTARDTVPGADCAGICVRHHTRGLETVALTHPVVYDADALQDELKEGPAYTELAAEDVVYSPDLSADARWPTYGPRMRDLGLLSQVSIELAHPLQAHAWLNLYSRLRNAFADYRCLGDLFSSQAKVALRYAQALQSLNGALASGATIERATGVVMERQGVAAEEALEYVVRLAQQDKVPLVDAAATILDQVSSKKRQPAKLITERRTRR